MKVTPEEYFKDQDTSKITHEQYCNAMRLLHVINLLREDMGIPFIVNSGFRSKEHNLKIGGSQNSHHMHCRAIDLRDTNGLIKAQLQANDHAMLKKYDLYMESPLFTPTWCHLQIVAPRSGVRVFNP